jgi:hypothetical protein
MSVDVNIMRRLVDSRYAVAARLFAMRMRSSTIVVNAISFQHALDKGLQWNVERVSQRVAVDASNDVLLLSRHR